MQDRESKRTNVRITPALAADYCQVSKGTALQWIKNGKLKAFCIPSGQYRIRQEDFRDFLERYDMPIEDWLFESESEKKGGE
ncbi:MAG: helix-turn-helix domain-containing protein [Dehalococcoidia bacterium]|nr:helix-turn-helix domain-containing protein [Dehalococcoidia bacterium]